MKIKFIFLNLFLFNALTINSKPSEIISNLDRLETTEKKVSLKDKFKITLKNSVEWCQKNPKATAIISILSLIGIIEGYFINSNLKLSAAIRKSVAIIIKSTFRNTVDILLILSKIKSYNEEEISQLRIELNALIRIKRLSKN